MGRTRMSHIWMSHYGRGCRQKKTKNGSNARRSARGGGGGLRVNDGDARRRGTRESEPNSPPRGYHGMGPAKRDQMFAKAAVEVEIIYLTHSASGVTGNHFRGLI